MNWAYYMVLIVAFWIILDLDVHEIQHGWTQPIILY
jgi:hypothetical protein